MRQLQVRDYLALFLFKRAELLSRLNDRAGAVDHAREARTLAVATGEAETRDHCDRLLAEIGPSSGAANIKHD